MKSLVDYVVTFDNVLPKESCEDLIKAYENASCIKRDNELMRFSEINMMDSPAFEIYKDPMIGAMQSISQAYKQQTRAFWPENLAYEQPRIKKYEPNDGYFNWHIDVSSAESARRMLVMFWYLNDVEEGGHTEFDLDGVEMKVEAKAGRVLCFPPNFMYPHRGATPLSGPKYVISSYVHLP